jgi:phage terminase large subunit-like protein
MNDRFDLSKMTADDRAELTAIFDEWEKRQTRRLVRTLFPDEGPLRRELYPKHMEFFAAGATKAERAFIAANRVGKTLGAGCEVTYHLTGQYPDWWPGRRWDRPTRWLASGDTHETTRDIIQLKMLGALSDRPDNIGTGLIPWECITGWTPRPHVPGAIERVRVKHTSGGESELWLRSYVQGRQCFQGIELDGFWPDEECPEDVYDEGLVRLMTTHGMSILTFTPLQGRTPLVNRLMDPSGTVSDRIVVQCGWDDVPHLDKDSKDKLFAKLPPHQRDARTKGIPSLGSGAIYPLMESDITCKPFLIPPHWKRAFAYDVGWNRGAAVWGAIDEDAGGVCYLYAEHYRAQAEPSIHVTSIKARGDWIPGTVDPAARGRSIKDGEQLIKVYNDLGLPMVPAANAVEAGIFATWELLSTGRLRIFTSLVNWLNEFRMYHRDEKGKVVKEHDHLMDATRYWVMTGRDLAVVNTKKFTPPTWRSKLEALHGQTSALGT